jgi:hypothetical protein
MTSFKLWLEARIISAGGAFGKDPSRMQQSKSSAKPIDRDTARFAQFDQRVQFGRSIEQKVVDALRTHVGWNIVPAEKSQDMFDKIDAWILKDGTKTAIQIKYRDTGTGDILFEVEKNGRPGRDMAGKAALYAVLNKEGTLIRVRLAAEAKRIASEMHTKLLQSGSHSIKTDKGEIRYQVDPSSGAEKIVAYIHPDAFTGAKKDVALPKSIWSVAA